jgi:TetR/AcrR family transcriptional repressor of nem operon
MVNRYFREIEDFFRSTIEEGKKAGEIPQAIQPGTTSRALLGLHLGIRVLARSGAPKTVIQTIARQAAALLGD